MKKAVIYILTITALVCLILLIGILLNGCGPEYKQISQDEAMQMMQDQTGYLIVDVRRADEFAEGHIPGAVNVSNESIQEEDQDQLSLLPDREQVLLIYCRSGNRSKKAAQKLAELGYTNVYEFGGINTWEGEIITE